LASALGFAFLCALLQVTLRAETFLGGRASRDFSSDELRSNRLTGYVKVWADGDLSYYEEGTTFRPASMAEGSARCAKTRRAEVAYLFVKGIDQKGSGIAYSLMVDSAQCESFAEAIVTRQVRRRVESTSAERRLSASVL
jgi:hypothetical protein